MLGNLKPLSGMEMLHRLSAIREHGVESRLGEHSAGRRPIVNSHQEPAWKGADGAFLHAYVLIGQDAGDAGLPQQRFGKAKQHGIVASQQLTHGHTMARTSADWT